MSRHHRAKAAAMPTTAPLVARSWPQIECSDAALSAAKWLALLLMVIDHSNKYLFSGSQAWMYAVGRISMPLFAVVLGYNLARPGLLASGGYRRIAVRLAVFGALATAPFIAINKLVGGWWPLNMMATLLVAVLVAWLLDLGGRWPTIAAYLVLVWGGALGEYWWPGVGLCLCAWAYRRKPSGGAAFGLVACLALLFFVNGNFWALGALPLLAVLRHWPVPLPRAQWAFYGFYPLHLALLWWYLSAAGGGVLPAGGH